MNIFIRSILLFIVLFIATRIMGRKQISQMTFFDYVVGITIGSIIAAVSVDRNIKFYDGVISTVVWTAAPLIIGWINLKSLRIRRITDGEPLIIIKDGVVNVKNMAKARYNIDDLLMQLREKDVFNLEEVNMAVLETDGVLTVLKKAELNNPTLKDLNIKPKDNGLMLDVVIDGVVIENNLKEYNKDKKWLNEQLEFRQINNIKKVIYAGLSSNNQLKIVKRK